MRILAFALKLLMYCLNNVSALWKTVKIKKNEMCSNFRLYKGD